MSSIVSKIWEDLNEEIRQLALRKLGPLAHFVGNWKGTGYAIISRPDAENGQLFKFQQNTTIEQMSFVPVIAPVLNRSAFADQKNIALKGLLYEQLVLDATDLTNILHFEIGQWIWVPETTNPANKASVARQANILHGTSFLATGEAPDQVPVQGRPEIELLDTIPTGPPVDQDPGYLDQITKASVPTGIPEKSNLNPSIFLTHQLDTQKVIDHVKFSVSARIPVTGSTDPNHELINIPFLDKHAQSRELKANFYIEHIEDPTSATRSSMQLQYGQRTILNFLNVNWPHVSVGSLKRHGL